MSWRLWWTSGLGITYCIDVIARDADQARAVAFALVPAVSVSMPKPVHLAVAL